LISPALRYILPDIRCVEGIGETEMATRRKGVIDRSKQIVATASVLFVPLGLAAQTLGNYVIDPQASRIEIHVFKGGLLGGLGDDHRIILGRFTGSAEAGTAGSWTVRVTGDAGSLEVKDRNASEATRLEIQQTMLGPTQLDVTHYPFVELRSRSVTLGSAPGSLHLLADLTLHGVTRQEEFSLATERAGDHLRVYGKKTLRLRDYRIQPVRKALGAVRVSNEFELVYDITLRRKTG
jgi:polyisoprenoid-binding protein YceI